MQTIKNTAFGSVEVQTFILDQLIDVKANQRIQSNDNEMSISQLKKRLRDNGFVVSDANVINHMQTMGFNVRKHSSITFIGI